MEPTVLKETLHSTALCEIMVASKDQTSPLVRQHWSCPYWLQIRVLHNNSSRPALGTALQTLHCSQVEFCKHSRWTAALPKRWRVAVGWCHRTAVHPGASRTPTSRAALGWCCSSTSASFPAPTRGGSTQREAVLLLGGEAYLWRACQPWFSGTSCCSSCGGSCGRCSRCRCSGSCGSSGRSPSWSGWNRCTGTQSSACPGSPGSPRRGAQTARAHT